MTQRKPTVISLPPLRALQAFEAVGRTGGVTDAAKELGVTPGAVSQKVRELEQHLNIALIAKDGRGLALTTLGRAYHDMLAGGFQGLREAQAFVLRLRDNHDITISGLPSLIIKWLNPQLPAFRAAVGDTLIRLECTHVEPNPRLVDVTFRLTYGDLALAYPHSRPLFQDHLFPVCAPEFLDRHPQARNPEGLHRLPLIRIAWGPQHLDPPDWSDWFAMLGMAPPERAPVASFSLSSLAIESALGGEGVVLGQDSFVARDLAQGRLVRLSDEAIGMPCPYHVCWSGAALGSAAARDFLDWLMAQSKPNRRRQPV